jgi:hypothetical protein
VLVSPRTLIPLALGHHSPARAWWRYSSCKATSASNFSPMWKRARQPVMRELSPSPVHLLHLQAGAKDLPSRFVAAFLSFSYPEFTKEIPMRPRSHFSESRIALPSKRSRKVAWPPRFLPVESAVV